MSKEGQYGSIRATVCASKVPRFRIAAVGWRRIAAALGVAGLFFSVAANAICCLEFCESGRGTHSSAHHRSAAPTATTTNTHGHSHAESPTPPCRQLSSVARCCLERLTVATVASSPETKRPDNSPLALASISLISPISFSSSEAQEHPSPPPDSLFDPGAVPLRI